MKRFTLLLGLILSMFLCGCYKTMPSRIELPVAPKVEQVVKPKVEQIQKGNKDLQKVVETQKETIALQKADLVEAFAQADMARLALEKAGITDGVISGNLLMALRNVERQNALLETGNKDLQTRLDAQIELTQEATNLAEKKDNEAKQWLENNRKIQKKFDDVLKERDTAFKERDEALIKLAKDSFYKKAFWIAVGIYVGLLVLRNVLMYFLPAFKLRI